MRKLLKVSSLKYIAAFLIPLIFTMFAVQAIDNDSWGVLAQGRYIFENGVYYTDVLSMHEGLNVVVQNYAFSVIFYLIYTAFGAVGLYVGLLILEFFVCFLIYKICMLLSDKNTNLSLGIMIVTSLLLTLAGFITTRAQMFSYIIFLGAIYVLELYTKTGKSKYLWWIPVFSLILINFHASIWLMIFLLLLVYIVDSIKVPKLHLQGYRTRPLLVVGLISFLIGFLNPYGVNMMTLMFSAYGDPTFMNLVIELQPFSLRTTSNVIIYGVIVVTLILCIFGKEKNIRMRFLLMFFGFLALGLNSVKGLSQFVLVMFFPLVLVYKNMKIEKVIEAKIARKIIIFWCGILTICIFVVSSVYLIPKINDTSEDGTLAEAIDKIDEINKQKGVSGGNVYVGYNDGGYVEFRGYKAYMDPRGGDFMKKINKKEDILQEYVDLKDGKIDLDDFLEKYDFDYILAHKYYGKIYEINREDYKLIYENDDVRVFEFIK